MPDEFVNCPPCRTCDAIRCHVDYDPECNRFPVLSEASQAGLCAKYLEWSEKMMLNDFHQHSSDVVDVVDQSVRMVQEIKKRSRQYVEDNLINPTPSDYLFAENLAMIGSCVALEMNG